MLARQNRGSGETPGWLLVLGLSACMLALAGCGGDEPTTDDESSADDDDSTSDDDDSTSDDDDSTSDDEDEDDDAPPSGRMDAGRDAGAGRDSGGGGGRDSGGGSGGRDSGGATGGDSSMGGRDSSMPSGGRDSGRPSPGSPPSSGSGCTPAPSGTFDTTMEAGGPAGDYVIFRPSTLGEGGFLHPPVAWGNGLATYPDFYTESLMNIASNGFVIIANPGSGSDSQVVRQGLEWLLEQNNSGEYAGKLAVDCAGAIGYSMGGGAAIGTGSHPAVKAVVSIHGLPDLASAVNGPLLLTTSDGDTFVTKSGFVMPNYTGSNTHPTIMATHSPQGSSPLFGDHLEPLGAGGLDTDPTIAWLRYWLYGDESQRDWFFGSSCKLCSDPWTDIQKKNHEWD